MNHEQLALIGPILTQKIETLFPQVAVDGGIRYATNPVLWVGDGDSGVAPTHIPVILKTSQDETDLRHALKQVQSWNWKQLHLYGFLGKRKDHEWANLGEVCQELASRPHISSAIFYDEELNPQILIFQSGSSSFAVNGLFSLFSFESAIISISGECRYEMLKLPLTPFSGRGVSNVGSGLIQVQSSAPFMVMIVGDEK